MAKPPRRCQVVPRQLQTLGIVIATLGAVLLVWIARMVTGNKVSLCRQRIQLGLLHR